MQNPAIWLFDSRCVLCSRGVQYTLRHEKAATIRFVAIQSNKGRALPGITISTPTIHPAFCSSKMGLHWKPRTP